MARQYSSSSENSDSLERISATAVSKAVVVAVVVTVAEAEAVVVDSPESDETSVLAVLSVEVVFLLISFPLDVCN